MTDTVNCSFVPSAQAPRVPAPIEQDCTFRPAAAEPPKPAVVPMEVEDEVEIEESKPAPQAQGSTRGRK